MTKKMRKTLTEVNEKSGECRCYDITPECFNLIIKALMETNVYTETEKATIARQFCQEVVTIDYVLNDILAQQNRGE